ADLRHQHRHIALLPQDVPDRPGDLGRRQRGGRNLVQQWLKAMMVLAIDHDHVDGNAAERLRRFEAAEACADDDDLWTRSHHAPSTAPPLKPAMSNATPRNGEPSLPSSARAFSNRSGDAFKRGNAQWRPTSSFFSPVTASDRR